VFHFIITGNECSDTSKRVVEAVYCFVLLEDSDHSIEWCFWIVCVSVILRCGAVACSEQRPAQ